MVYCAVYGCNSSSNKNNGPCQVRFFKFPSTNSKIDEKLYGLVLKRRSLWLSRIARKDLTMYDGHKILYSKVCSKHFLTGAPSHLKDMSNPDWAPSINLGHNYFEKENEEFERPQISEQLVQRSHNMNAVDSDEEKEEYNHKGPSLAVKELESVEEDTSLHGNNENGQDRLKYFIFSGSSKSNNPTTMHNITHDEALKAAETLLSYMENQDNVDHADLILIRGYRNKVLQNMKQEE